MTYIPTLTHATERDIDLLLVEEFVTSRTFTAWFLNGIGIASTDVGEVSVFHSVRRMHSRREIDISVEVRTKNASILLLVENKLDADEQPNQDASYQEEAKSRADQYDHVLTVLICPKNYALKHGRFASGFDAVFNYEKISRYFEVRAGKRNDEIGARCAHRGRMMLQAIEKARRSYTPVVHPGKRAFAKGYISLLEELDSPLIPGPSMLKEGGAESVTMIFSSDTLPKWSFLPQMRIVHQLREANANICFYTWGDHFSRLAQEMAPALLGTEFRLVPTINKRRSGRSGLMVVAETPKIDQFADFDDQIVAIKAGITATERLRTWLLRVSVIPGQAFQ